MTKIKILILFFFLICPIFLLTGCTQKATLEDLAYVIAIGIDKGEDNLLKLSLQFATPSSSSSGGDSSSSASSESTISTAECASVDSGLNLINSYISKKINLSHCKAIVFSEDLAVEGIKNEISALFNNIEIRPDCSIIISRCNASDFLNNSKPILVNLVERYYEVVVASGDYTGYSANIKLIDFYSSLKDSSIQPVAILGGINTPETHYINQDANYIDLDSSYKAGEALIKHKNNLEIMGLAVFNQDKLVGELNGMETISYLLVTGNLKNSTLNIPDPFNSDNVVSLSLKQVKPTSSKVQLVNNSAFITCKIPIEANILSLNNNSDYSKGENLDILSQYLDSYLESHISSFLYKTSKDYNSDILGFGRKTLSQYADFNSWNKLKWLENYQNATFSVDVQSSIKSSYLLLKN